MDHEPLQLEKAGKKVFVIPAVQQTEEVVPKLRSSAAKRQWIITLLANMSILSAGMALGFPAISLSELTSPLSKTQLTATQASWFASINTITCPLGGLLASYILDKVGRKLTMVLINVLSVVAWSLQAWADKEDTQTMYYQLLAARLIIGVAGGLSSSPVTVYAAEISHPKLRGRLTGLSSVSIAFGVLLIYFFGFVFQNDLSLISMIALGISIVSFFVSLMLPESPRWLARKHQFKKAEKAYRKLNGSGNDDIETSHIGKEMQTLIEQCKKPVREEHDVKMSFWQKLKRPTVYKPLTFLLGFFTFQQLCGVFVIVVYIGQLATSVGVTVNIFIFTVITGCCRFIGVLVSAFGCDKLGRRKLGIVSGLGVSMSTLAVAVCLWYPTEKSHWYAAFFILVYVFVSTIGYLTLPFALVAELYPPDVRGFAAGINVCYAYTLAFVVIKSYPFVSAAVGPDFILTFISITSLAGVAFIYRFLPETKGKTMKELEEIYK